MIVTNKTLSRRSVLRGVGAAVALPMLDAMTPAISARSAPAAATRLAFFYVPQCMQPEFFEPKTVGRDFEITPILQPLAAFRDQMLVVTGLDNQMANPFETASGPHTRCGALWLCGTRPKRTEGGDIQLGTTLDEYAARELGKATALPSLELGLEQNMTVGNCEGGYSCTYINTFSWRSPTMPLPMETNPYVVFERLFGDGGGASARRAQMRRYRSLLDTVMEDMHRLDRTLGPQDRATLGEYLDSVRDLEERLQRIEQHTSDSSVPADKPLGIPPTYDEHAKLMMDLVYLAFRGDITRVLTFMIARELSARSYPELGVPEAHHDVSHHANNPEKKAKHAKINTHHVSFFARLVEKMRDTPDGDGTLLDHSMLVYGSGMGEGDRHLPLRLPTVVLGGGSGQLKPGRHIRAADETPFMNFGLSMLDKVGVHLESIGDSTGRLAEL